jgi:hypothetical protein
MSVFLLELKKIWNRRILLVIAVLCALTWLAFLRDFQSAYDSLLVHGTYGAYQTQMFERYGVTLEPDELEDFDIPGKKAALVAQMDEMIAGSPVFAEYGIRSFAEYQAFTESGYEDYGPEEANAHNEAAGAMERVLWEWKDGITLDEWYASPLMRYGCLLNLESRYIGYENEMQTQLRLLDGRPVAQRSAQRLLTSGNNSLIAYFLSGVFSQYAAVTAIVSVLITLLLVSPLIVADRQRGMNLLQYASSAGRRIIRYQFAAIAVSAFMLSLFAVCAGFLPILAGRAADYWNAPVMAYGSGNLLMNLYDLTFGQYVAILGAMSVLFSVGAACVAFVLARFSGNIVFMFIKAVPLAALFGMVSFFALKNAFAYSRMDMNFLRGKIDAPEVWACLPAALIGFALAAWVIWREKRVDVT